MASHTELSRLNQLMKIEDAAMRNQLKEAVSRLLTSVLQVRRWWFFVLFEISRILEIISRRSSIFTEISTETMTLHIFRLDRDILYLIFWNPWGLMAGFPPNSQVLVAGAGPPSSRMGRRGAPPRWVPPRHQIPKSFSSGFNWIIK